MNKTIALSDNCTPIGSQANASTGHLRSLRDRFRGVLLGLWLAPTAVSAGPASASNQTGLLAEAAAFSLLQTSAFLRRPHAFDLSRAQMGKSLYGGQSSLLASIPLLLRYCDRWERRLGWIDAQRSTVARVLHQPEAAITHFLVLGDLLELLLCRPDSSPVVGLSQLQKRSVRYALSATEQRRYDKILAELSAGVATESFAEAALIALLHPESYSLPVQIAASRKGIDPLVTAVVAGAMGGRASLPAHWQLSQRCSEVVAIADDLFGQWAGAAR